MNRILSLANVPEKDFCELINEGKIDDASIEIYLKEIILLVRTYIILWIQKKK